MNPLSPDNIIRSLMKVESYDNGEYVNYLDVCEIVKELTRTKVELQTVKSAWEHLKGSWDTDIQERDALKIKDASNFEIIGQLQRRINEQDGIRNRVVDERDALKAENARLKDDIKNLELAMLGK